MKKLKADKIGIVLTIIILISLIFLTNNNQTIFSFPEKIANNIISPIQNCFVYIKNKLNKNTSFFENIESLKNENSSLKEQNENLEKLVKELDIIKAENKTLKESLSLTKQYPEYTCVSAQVINTSFDNYSSILTINVGENDGIKLDMPVISSEGLVR